MSPDENRHRIVVINPNSSVSVTQAIHETLAPLRFDKGPAIDCLTLAEGPPGIETQDHIESVVDPICETIRREEPKVKRNDPCPCGSGKKYKQCCGRT